MIEANSASPIYIYNSYKILLVIFPSVKTLSKLINSNHATILNFIQKGTLFRGEWYFSYKPYNITDLPLYSKWSLNIIDNEDINNLILEMINNSHIKKAVFVYNLQKEFL